MPADFYLSEDLDSNLRSRAPVTCRLCDHLLIKRSCITDRVEMSCERPKGKDADVLGYILLRMATRGRCDLFKPFGMFEGL